MKFWLMRGSLGYAGTDFGVLFKGETEEELLEDAEQAWRQEAESAGAVYTPDYDADLDSGEMSEEEFEEICDDALHGMVCYEMDYALVELTSLQELEEADNEFGIAGDFLYEEAVEHFSK